MFMGGIMFITREQSKIFNVKIKTILSELLKDKEFVLLKETVTIVSEKLDIPATNTYHYVYKVLKDPKNGFERVTLPKICPVAIRKIKAGTVKSSSSKIANSEILNENHIA